MIQTVPDGIEVVATRRERGPEALEPLLVLDALESYLDLENIGTGPIAWERIGEGHSNVNYRVVRGDAQVVLRRGPRPPFPRSAHDMVREAELQQQVGQQDVPVPTIRAICRDDEVLGTPFYLMDWLDGEVVTSTLPPWFDDHEARSELGTTALVTLANLHDLPLTNNLASFGRPNGYLRRQVERFASLWDQNTTRSLPAVAQLAGWLEANRPDSQRESIVHGDYRIGNLMISPRAPVRVKAVLDWELATLGDPLADLGYFLATYAEPGDPPSPMELTPVTRKPGFPRRSDLLTAYVERTGLDVAAIAWYEALALWKAAVFCEAIYTRYLRGERPGDTFGPTLEVGVPLLLELAEARRSSMR